MMPSLLKGSLIKDQSMAGFLCFLNVMLGFIKVMQFMQIRGSYATLGSRDYWLPAAQLSYYLLFGYLTNSCNSMDILR